MRNLLRPLFVVEIALLAALLVSFPALDPGSATYIIALLSLGVIAFTLLGIAVVARLSGDDGS